MIRIVVAIRDRASDTFGTPLCFAARGQAIRTFSDEVNRRDENNQMYKHPEDFDLYELGEFDDSSGLFNSGVPKQIAVGKDLRVREDVGLRAVN